MKFPKRNKKLFIILSTAAIALVSILGSDPVLAGGTVTPRERFTKDSEIDYGFWGDDDETPVIIVPAEDEEDTAEVETVKVLVNNVDGFLLRPGKGGALRWETADKEQVVIASTGLLSNKINLYKEADAFSDRVGEMDALGAGVVDSVVEDPDGDWYHIKSGDVRGYARAAFFVSGAEAYELITAARIPETEGTVNLTVASAVTDHVTVIMDLEPEVKAKTQEEEQTKTDTKESTGTNGENGTENSNAITVASNKEGLRRQVRENFVVEIYTPTEETTTGTTGSGANLSDVNWSALAAASAQRQALVKRALSFVGGRYVHGGNDPHTGADCSGFTRYLYKEIGITIPRSSRAQATAGTRIPLSQIRPGDLVFYAKNGKVYHVAMYIGDGRLVHARNPRLGIVTSKVTGKEYCAISLLP